MTQPIFKDTSMRARALFKSANSFIGEHISFTLFYILLMIMSEFLGYVWQLRLRPSMNAFMQSIGSSDPFPTDTGSIFQNIVPEESIRSFVESNYALFALFGGYFVIVLAFLIVLFCAQSLLRKRDASLIHEIGHGLHALIKAPWVLLWIATNLSFIFFDRFGSAPLFFIFYCLYILIICIPLYYAQPLLYDNYYSFSSIWKTSWGYVKQSWFVSFKYLILIMLLYVPFGIITYLISLKAFPSLVMLSSFCLRLYTGLLSYVGYSMIYNHLRSRE